LVDFTRRLVLPVRPRLERPVERNGPGTGTIIHTAAAVPALIRVQDHRGLAFLGIGDIDINLTDFDAMIAAVATLRIESDRLIGSSDIRHGDYFILGHIFLQ
jgi:hypothetical protein